MAEVVTTRKLSDFDETRTSDLVTWIADPATDPDRIPAYRAILNYRMCVSLTKADHAAIDFGF